MPAKSRHAPGTHTPTQSYSFSLTTLLLSVLLILGTTVSASGQRQLRFDQQVVELNAPVPENGSGFGLSVGTSGDVVIVGAAGGVSDGAAYLFFRPEAGWQDGHDPRVVKLTGESVEAWGGLVTLEGHAFATRGHNKPISVFEKPVGGWSQVSGPTTRIHLSSSAQARTLRITRKRLLAAAPNRSVVDPVHLGGAVLIWQRPRGGWGQLDPADVSILESSSPSLNDRVGRRIAMGKGLVVASSADDFAYVFLEPPRGWRPGNRYHEVARLVSPFQSAVAVSADNRLIAVSGGGQIDGVWRRYVNLFVKPPSGWSGTLEPTATLLASDELERDDALTSVVFVDRSVVVGRPGDWWDGSTATGALYVYDEPPGGWEGWTGILEESSKVDVPDSQPIDMFGFAIYLGPDFLVVGTQGWLMGKGAAYLFFRDHSHLFSDGFESGSTSEWSNMSTPSGFL